MKNKFTLFFGGIGIVLNIANWIVLFFIMKSETPQIALHYNPFYGPDLYGTWGMVLRLPLLGFIILFAHSTLGAIFFQKERLASHLLMGVACVFQLFIFISILTIAYINTTGN